MTNCNDPRKNCGQIIPDSCVPFTGIKPIFIDDDDFPCDVNIKDIVVLANAEIDRINDDNDLTELEEGCLDFDPATVTIKDLHQVEITEICALRAELTTLQDTINDLDIGAELVTVDLGAMTPMTNPCSPTTNQYTLFYILQAFADKLNTL